MIFQFGDSALDLDRVELRRGKDLVPIEPQVFSLLCLLVENRHRAVSKTEILEKIWDGRVVSESALSSRIKSARQAIGDNGVEQRLIKTLRGHGFRFVADVKVRTGRVSELSEPEKRPAASDRGDRKPAIAVLPFAAARDGEPGILADGLPQELITAFSRLRWLSVIARGSSFRFRDTGGDVRQLGVLLDIDYAVSGTLSQHGERVELTVELSDCRDGHVVWGQQFEFDREDLFATRESILSSIVAALELHIPRNEAERARLSAPNSLGAWAEYHLGLQAMYRFNKADNAVATAHFLRATERDPEFARAHAGLSFTSFQDAFLNYSKRPGESALAARRHAERAVELDAMDAFASFTMGRSYFLSEDHQQSFGWLDRALDLSPNFSQGYYSRGWAETLFGNAGDGLRFIESAMRLSPLDPFMYAMMGTRALAHIERGEYTEGALWAEKGASAPYSHVMLAIIAVAAHALNGNEIRAHYWVDNVRRRRPDVDRALFFSSFPFENASMLAKLDEQLKRLGL